MGRFKVGDRVRYSDNLVDGFGTVRDVDHDGGCYVTVEEKDRAAAIFFDDTARFFADGDLTPVAEPPAIPPPTYTLTALGRAYADGYAAGLAAATAQQVQAA